MSPASRAPDPLRLIILIAVLAFVGIRVHYWYQGERRAAGWTRGSSTLAGRVVDTDGRPVERAYLFASSQGSERSGGNAHSGADGRFSIGTLAAGVFTIEVTKKDYLRASYGEFAPGANRSAVELADGETRDGLTITMFRGGTIAGTLLDPKGQPTPGCTARLHKPARAYWPGDELWARMQISQTPLQTATGGTGQFRFANIAPGTYTLHATCDAARLARTFYPGTWRSAAATLIHVGAGESRTGLELRLKPPPLSTMSGTVRGTDGKPIVAQVALSHATGGLQTSSNATGHFMFSDVSPEDYAVIAHAVVSSRHLWARAEVSTDGRTPASVDLTLQPGRTLTARVSFTALHDTPEPTRTWMMLLGADAGSDRWLRALGYSASTPDNVGGVYVIKDVPPGRYFLRVAAEYEPQWQVESAVLDGQDWLDAPAALGADRDHTATVTLIDDAATISGRVGGSGSPATGAEWVVAFAENPALRIPPRRAQVVRVEPDGRYFVGRLPAGTYLLAAVADVNSGAWPAAGFFEPLTAGAVRVTLGRAEKKTLDLPRR